MGDSGIVVNTYLHTRDRTPAPTTIPDLESLMQNLREDFVECPEETEKSKKDAARSAVPLMDFCSYTPDAPSRKKEYLVSYSPVLGIDLDDTPKERFEELIEVLDGVCYGAYPSYSHQTNSRTVRYRLLFALDRPVKPDEYKAFWVGFVEVFLGEELGFDGIGIDPQCKNPNRMFYIPCGAAWKRDAVEYRDGEPFSVDEMVAKGRAVGADVLDVRVAVSKEDRGRITPQYKKRAAAYLQETIDLILTRGEVPMYDVKNDRAFTLGGFIGAKAIPERRVREELKAAFKRRYDGKLGAETKLYEAMMKVQKGLEDGSSVPLYPSKRYQLLEDLDDQDLVKAMLSARDSDGDGSVPDVEQLSFDPIECQDGVLCVEGIEELGTLRVDLAAKVWKQYREDAKLFPLRWEPTTRSWAFMQPDKTHWTLLPAEGNISLYAPVTEDYHDRFLKKLAGRDHIKNVLRVRKRLERGMRALKEEEIDVSDLIEMAKDAETSERLGAASALMKDWDDVQKKAERVVEAFCKMNPFNMEEANLVRHKLAVRNGVINLKTGMLEPADPDDLITSSLDVDYDPTATCPTFDSFLQSCHPKDPSMPGFLWRLMGYSITGEVQEQQCYIHFGGGSNGKSTFLNILSQVLGMGNGGLVCHPPVDLISRRAQEKHPADLMMMFGRRVAIFTEPASGTSLDESRIKSLTGGDPITARYMRANFTTFLPTSKIHIATNSLPSVHDDDVGIWRRLVPIPWTRHFSAEEADVRMEEKCLKESQGILARAVQEAKAWYALREQEDYSKGLRPPTRVSDEWRKYREDEDPMRAFLDCSEDLLVDAHDSNISISRNEIWRLYVMYSNNRGEQVFRSSKHFYKALERRGFHSDKIRVYGITSKGSVGGFVAKRMS